MKNILVTGGAGYIGSLVSQQLIHDGHNIHIIDNLDTGHISSVPAKASFLQGDLRDLNFVRSAFTKINPDSVIHLAAKASVPESVKDPIGYFQNNVGGSLNLLQCIQEFEVKKLIFSSTAAVYSGKGANEPITTDEVPEPQNPYGLSKLFIEDSIAWLCEKSDLRAVALRYFNVAGASLDGKLGQRTKGSGHLLKKVSEYLVGKESSLKVFGNDYPTKDGTGIRDYIHVVDLAEGHLAALDFLKNHQGWEVFNLGTGHGISVFEMISSYKHASGKEIAYQIKGRRTGDIASCYTTVEKSQDLLQWRTRYILEQMCKSSWLWQNMKNDSV